MVPTYALSIYATLILLDDLNDLTLGKSCLFQDDLLTA